MRITGPRFREIASTGTSLHEWAHARRLTAVQVMGVLGQVARALEGSTGTGCTGT